MKENLYKLGEIKIIESDTGELRWESHFGLGEIQEGWCFRKGAILFIGPAESQRDGFLILEFTDHLKEFPDWLKTKYFCRNLDVFHCNTGKKVSREEMRLWMLDPGSQADNNSVRPADDSDDLSSLMSRENVGFRLQRYEINKRANGQVAWKTYAGPGRLKAGTCIILEDILFIGPQQNEQTNLIKRQFLEGLKKLPEWNQTKYYCHSLSCLECKFENRVQAQKKFGERNKSETGKQAVRNGYKNKTESKIVDETRRGIFSARILPIFDSLAESAKSRREHERFFRFKFKKPFISKGAANFCASNILKWLTHAVALIFLIISSIFAFIIDRLKKHYERRHFKKGKHPSSRRKDH